jgi:hypothetical protein
MSIGCFTDKQLKPAEDAIRTAIGRMLPLWDVLLAHIRATYLCDQDWRFLYGKSYGWGLRVRGRGQLLTNLYPAAGGFAVQINLSEGAVAQAPWPPAWACRWPQRAPTPTLRGAGCSFLSRLKMISATCRRS